MADATAKTIFILCACIVIFLTVYLYFSPYSSCIRAGWSEKICAAQR
jgi:hypothetical protein